MDISLFDLFSIGIGPSSSHTVGPMRAAKAFVMLLGQRHQLSKVNRLRVDLYGSLALTGLGHSTDKAILCGLQGYQAETIEPQIVNRCKQETIESQKISLAGKHRIHFTYKEDLHWHQREFLPNHANGMRFTAYQDDKALMSRVYYSIGGGFICTDEAFNQCEAKSAVPFPFNTTAELLTHCRKHQMRIDEVTLANEKFWRSEQQVQEGILTIAATMQASIDAGCQASGTLPGPLHIKRRAPELYQKLTANSGIHSIHEKVDIMNLLNLYAMAVNEENAAGGRIVTAPTNGAAGIIPAVMAYYNNSHRGANEAGLIKYFLTASAIAILYKKRASLSGAEVGCQGEVGVASSMAAGGLTAALGGNINQIENAAEIAMEHHLGMTCDPIGGLVQIPCIERNAMGAVKAVNAARMALIANGKHKVSLDKVIRTMKQTGQDMMTKYKETSQGGLAVNIPEC